VTGAYLSETTTELRERLASLRRLLQRDTTGRTAEPEREIKRVEAELERRAQFV